MFHKQIEFIRTGLTGDLPGETAHQIMTSRARISTAEYLKQNPTYRKSAVVMNLFPFEGRVSSMLIRRNDYQGTHSGQLALPGGKMDEIDESLLHTALREMKEEVGVEVSEQNIIGALTPVYIPVSNFLVQPFVAVHNTIPEWIPDKSEVAGILEFELEELFDPASKDRRRISIGKNLFIEAPCYIVNGQILWGATAMMFAELETIFSRFK